MGTQLLCEKLGALASHVVCPFAKAEMDVLLSRTKDQDMRCEDGVLWIDAKQHFGCNVAMSELAVRSLVPAPASLASCPHLLHVWVLVHGRMLSQKTTAEEWVGVVDSLFEAGVRGPEHPLVLASGEGVARCLGTSQRSDRDKLLHACLRVEMRSADVVPLLRRAPLPVPVGWSTFRITQRREGCQAALLALDLFGKAHVSPDLATIATSQAVLSRLREWGGFEATEHVAYVPRVTRGFVSLSSLFRLLREAADAHCDGLQRLLLSAVKDIISTLHTIRVVETDCRFSIGDVETEECKRAVDAALKDVLFDEDDVVRTAEEDITFARCIERVGAFLHAIEYDDRAEILEQLESIETASHCSVCMD